MYFLLKMGIFMGYVSLPEGNSALFFSAKCFFLAGSQTLIEILQSSVLFLEVLPDL